MALTIITGDFAKRDAALAFDEIAPGLYEGEIAVKVTGRDKVAVSVAPTWLENGAGVWLDGNARWIDASGKTRLSPDGKHVESNVAVTASMADVEEFGIDALARDVAIMLLGEGDRVMRAADPANDVPARPVFMVEENALSGASIKKAIDAVRSLTNFSLSLAL